MVLWNYIGSKYTLLKKLGPIFQTLTKRFTSSRHCPGSGTRVYTFYDLFAGTGCVSNYMSKRNAIVTANDVEYYSYILNKGYLQCRWTPYLQIIIDNLNSLTLVNGSITQNYATGSRKFFTKENAMLIDAACQYATRLRDKKSVSELEYYFLMASIIESADRSANIACVYGSYLKQIKSYAKRRIEFKPIHTKMTVDTRHKVYNLDCLELLADESLAKGNNADIVYLDPPYNKRQYGSNYHVLNYIAKVYDKSGHDFQLYGMAGLIKGYYKSPFCQKAKALKTFTELLSLIQIKLNPKYLVLSYNNEGIIPFNTMIKMLMQLGHCWVYRIKHTKFKSTPSPNGLKYVYEYVYVVDMCKPHPKTNKYFVIDF